MSTTAPSSAAADASKPFFACQPVDARFFEEAPARFTTTVDLEASPAKVFAILDDENAWPVWVSPGIKRVIWTTPRPHGVGTTRTVEMSATMAVYESFFVWDEGKELAFYFTGATQEVWSRFAERYVLTPLGEGKTRLTWTMAYEPLGWFARLHFLVKPLMGIGLGMYLKKLARYVERQA